MESIYIVKEGILEFTLNGKEIKKIGANEFFGENSLIFDINLSNSVKTFSEISICYQVPKTLLIESIGENFKDILITEIVRQAFYDSHLFRNGIIEDNFSEVFNTFIICKYKSDDIIFKKGSEKNMPIMIVAIGNMIYVSLV